MIDGQSLCPVITEVAAFRRGMEADPLAVGVELLWTGRPEEADAWFAGREQSVRVRALRADCARDLGQHDRALAQYESLVAECAGSQRESVMRQHRGKALLSAGLLEEALSEVEHALRLRLADGAAPDLVASSRLARDRIRALLARAPRRP